MPKRNSAHVIIYLAHSMPFGKSPRVSWHINGHHLSHRAGKQCIYLLPPTAVRYLRDPSSAQAASHTNKMRCCCKFSLSSSAKCTKWSAYIRVVRTRTVHACRQCSKTGTEPSSMRCIQHKYPSILHTLLHRVCSGAHSSPI